MASTLQRHHVGASLARAVSFGDLVFVSGTTADDLSAGCRGQTRDVLQQIERVLTEAGSDKAHILWCNVWLTDIREKDEMDAAWREWIPEGHTPARATVESRLSTPDRRVEISMICARSEHE